MNQLNVIHFQAPVPDAVTQEDLEEVLSLAGRLKERRQRVRAILEAGGTVESGPRRIRIENYSWALNGKLIIIE